MSGGAALAPTGDRFADGAEDGVAWTSRSEADDLALLAGLCDRARRSDPELDTRIALALFPSLGSLQAIAPGVWAHADGRRTKALRYSGSSVAAMTLVPSGHRVECSVEVVGRIEIVGADGAAAVGWGRNDHFPLAAAAAALRARAALARSLDHGLRLVEAPPATRDGSSAPGRTTKATPAVGPRALPAVRFMLIALALVAGLAIFIPSSI